MTTREKIIKLLQDESLTGWDLIKSIEVALINEMPYDHSKDSVMEACRFEEVKSFIFEGKAGGISKNIERLENKFPKRFLAMVLLDCMLSGKHQMNESRSKYPESVGDALNDLFKETGVGEFDHSKCDEEDSSECYKCKFNKVCTKFK